MARAAPLLFALTCVTWQLSSGIPSQLSRPSLSLRPDGQARRTGPIWDISRGGADAKTAAAEKKKKAGGKKGGEKEGNQLVGAFNGVEPVTRWYLGAVILCTIAHQLGGDEAAKVRRRGSCGAAFSTQQSRRSSGAPSPSFIERSHELRSSTRLVASSSAPIRRTEMCAPRLDSVALVLAGLGGGAPRAAAVAAPPQFLTLDSMAIFKGLQLWRPFTAASYLGALSVGSVSSIVMLVTHGQELERLKGSANFAMFVAIQIAVLTALGCALGFPQTSQSLITATIYCCSRQNAFASIQWQFGLTLKSVPSLRAFARGGVVRFRAWWSGTRGRYATVGALATPPATVGRCCARVRACVINCVWCLTRSVHQGLVTSSVSRTAAPPVARLITWVGRYWMLPFGLMGFDVLQGQQMAAAFPHLLGILSGHFYHFFTQVGCATRRRAVPRLRVRGRIVWGHGSRWMRRRLCAPR